MLSEREFRYIHIRNATAADLQRVPHLFQAFVRDTPPEDWLKGRSFGDSRPAYVWATERTGNFYVEFWKEPV